MKKLRNCSPFVLFIVRLFFALILFAIHRLVFLLFNYNSFDHAGIVDSFIYGMRFDLAAIGVYFLPFVLFSILPFINRSSKIYRITTFWTFIIATIITTALALLDSVYFNFTQTRSTADLFNVIALGSDFTTLLFQYIRDFWFAFILLAMITGFSVWFLRITSSSPKHCDPISFKKGLIQILVFFCALFLTMIAIRGGVQLRPLSIVNAGQYVPINNTALILNTPFTVMKTIGKKGLQDPSYFPVRELDKIYSPVHHFEIPDSLFCRWNIVFIVMESFSAENSSLLNKHASQKGGYMPFTDSLMKESLYFTNAYANGKRSIEAIPAIFSGIPALMNEAYITSIYSGNKVNSIASLLKTKGYTSAFFHGGTNGTMGFDGFIKQAGFDYYYGRSEFNDETQYDGKWGIFDEPFFMFAGKSIGNMPSPFVAGIFSLSSHHPYQVPEKYLTHHPTEDTPFHTSIRYADYSLRKFFEYAQQQVWFANTIFVVTADHTGESEQESFLSRTGMYKIPIFYYMSESRLKQRSETITQQTDILPTLLSMLGFNSPFVSFGEDAMDTTAFHFAVNYTNESYQLIYKHYAAIFSDDSKLQLFDLTTDPGLKQPLYNMNKDLEKLLTEKTKAIIQSYNNRMIHNKLTPTLD